MFVFFFFLFFFFLFFLFCFFFLFFLFLFFSLLLFFFFFFFIYLFFFFLLFFFFISSSSSSTTMECLLPKLDLESDKQGKARQAGPFMQRVRQTHFRWKEEDFHSLKNVLTAEERKRRTADTHTHTLKSREDDSRKKESHLHNDNFFKSGIFSNEFFRTILLWGRKKKKKIPLDMSPHFPLMLLLFTSLPLSHNF